jgi:hypothetical protein
MNMKKTTLLFVSLIFGLFFQMQSQTLIAHWPLKVNADDVTVNERHLTVAGTSWNWITNDIDRGQVFESTASGVKLSISVTDALDALNVRSNFTVSLWVKNTGTPYVWNNTGTRLISKNLQFQINGGSNNSQVTSGDNVTTRLRSGSTNYALAPNPSPVSFSDGEWHHLTLTMTSDYLATLYVNGIAVSTSQLSNIADVSGTVVEVATAIGRFSDARIYNSALAVEDVNVLMNLNRLSPPTLGAASDVLTDRFTINWSEVENASSYRVKVYQGSSLITTQTVNSATQFEVTGLSPNTEYSYSVAAVGDGETYYSSSPTEKQTITTNISTSFRVVDNNKSVTFRYHNGAIICSQTGDVELYNMQGIRLIKKNAVDGIPVDLKPGLYILNFSNKTQITSTKLLIQ